MIKINRYIQRLELEHLVKMVGLYNKFCSELGLKITSSLKINHLQIPYYASQYNIIAGKIDRIKS
ncbi:MAG: hypothetical protein A2161_07750 [Candidatus Schekmanbacteria bacterium RBG_13_48_7]|uniref:Uncharacterized protein n=1 Tax=Candidatus Schekmanbacteria bacterium RBG_13_48_7 TaxID=1817878 RepID=A0A1F7RZE0_9BACT|nr:MAG: hypothetical protein A2161_07750 [Candidatus Schekmanbacteria bacterium RBG_13_48_7]